MPVSAHQEVPAHPHPGVINLLPALPGVWAKGRIEGLRARGGFEVDIAWKDGKLTTARIISIGGTTCSVRNGSGICVLNLKKGQSRQLTPNDFSN